MAYFMLSADNTIIADITDDRSATFHSKIGWDDDVDRFKSALEVLEGRDAPLYSDIRMKAYFPNMIEIDKSAYDSAREEIDDFNSKQKLMLAEINNTPNDEIREYVSLFPATYPELLNYAQLAKLRMAMDMVKDPSADSPGEVVLSEEDELANIRALYGMLREVERSKDNSMIVSLLNLVGDAVEPDDIFGSEEVDLELEPDDEEELE
tara:strand:- start:2573 stop:3196 length:624 start_codon:yes stop_codon:yes gene_type:complete